MQLALSSIFVIAAVTTTAAAQSMGAVYTQTNDAASNAVLAFDRIDGALSFAGSFGTGGVGDEMGLGSQGSVVLTRDARFLLVTNAGSNDVSVMRVDPAGPTLVDREASRGVRPTSVAVRGGRVYVLNVGDMAAAPNVAGFTLDPSGDLAPIAAAPSDLAMGSAPAQVGIAPNLAQVFVTERATNVIDAFPILMGGGLGAAIQLPSIGATPFGFEFSRDRALIVSEAAGGAMDASTVSSYVIGQGSLSVVTPAMPTTETAACWIALARRLRFAYTTNTGSGTVTGYSVTPGTGVLTRLDVDGVTGDLGAGANPIDAAVSRDDKHLFVLSPATGEIAAFLVRVDGSLEKLPSELGLPSTAFGLAAR